jgi:hypothetical protein
VLAVIAMTVGLSVPSAAASSCIAQAVAFERGQFGTGFGPFVSSLARNPGVLGFANLGEFVSGFATADQDACPFE